MMAESKAGIAPPTLGDRIYPYKEDIPNGCGSKVGKCGTGRKYACTANKGESGGESNPLVAYFDTSEIVGRVGRLHFWTGIAPYADQNPEYKVLLNGKKIYEDSYEDGGEPYEVTVDFDIESEETVVKWINTVPEDRDWTWLIIGTEDCDPTTTESFIEIIEKKKPPEKGKPMPLWQKVAIGTGIAGLVGLVWSQTR